MMKPYWIRNAATRTLSQIFPGFFNTNTKHNFYADFGYPENLEFGHFYAMWRRNGLAASAVNKTKGKTWQTSPNFLPDGAKETPEDFVEFFARLKFWQNLARADARSMVGGYAGVILRFADGKRFFEPVDRVPGNLYGLVEIIPAWAGQLTVSEWDQDETSETYGKPMMFAFNEAAVGTQKTARSFTLHPDRVVIWSSDQTVDARSALEPGYNNLIDLEKISGAGGEGFWKNAKSAPNLDLDKDADIQSMASTMGVPAEEVRDKLEESVADWQKGFDRLLLTQGMNLKTLPVTLPDPEKFFQNPLMVFAASMCIPLKILVGSQTGERASTEDANEWAQFNNSRRETEVIPNITAVFERLIAAGIISAGAWKLDWEDLTEATREQKIKHADGMAKVNETSVRAEGQPVFTTDEIRQTAGFEGATPEGEIDEGE